MMTKFIEIPVFLIDNSDDEDDVDYESMGIKAPEVTKIEETILLNISTIQRVNRAKNESNYRTCIWATDGEVYHCQLEYDEVKSLIFK